MWDDARTLNAMALVLAGIAVALLSWSALAWLVRQPAFAISEVVVTTPLERANGAHGRLPGRFFLCSRSRARRMMGYLIKAIKQYDPPSTA